MNNLLLTAILLTHVVLGAGSNVDELELLATKADVALKGMESQRIFAQEESKVLAQAVVEDMQDNKGFAVVQLLRSRAYDSPAWQIVTQKIIEHPYSGAEPTRESLKVVESIFTATIRQGEHWLYYSPPRGWNSPHRLRSQLARVIILARNGKDEMVDSKLLMDDPAAWLVKYGIDQKGANPASPVSRGKDAKPLLEASPAAVAYNAALEASPDTAPLTASQAPPPVAAKSPSDATISRGLPGYVLWLAGGTLAVSVLTWMALKKRS